MRKIFVLLILLPATGLFALELDINFNIGNLCFPSDYASTSTGISGEDYPWGISAGGTHKLNDNVTLKAGFLMDPILRNIIYTEFQYVEDFFAIGVGPFFGAFNDESIMLNSGISTSITAQIPGIMFVNFRTDNSIGTRMVETGNYIQTRNEIAFGFYVPHAICSFYLDSRDYTEVVDDGEVKTAAEDYIFGVEIYSKNVPYKINMKFGYEHLTKSFYLTTGDSVHTLGSILVGVKFDMQFTDAFGFYIDVDSNVYAFGYNDDVLLDLPDSGFSSFLFQAKAGIRLDITKLARGNKVIEP
ncbi:MAG: hypothetical protein JW874_10815 [Spirochaetales bacterium]|nr:hypothetical protein [Spirochaetales bacterium]